MKNSKFSGGQAMLAVVLVMLATSAMLTATYFESVGFHTLVSYRELNRERASHFAEAGINRALYELRQDVNWTGVGETALGDGTYEVAVISAGADRTIESIGYIPEKSNFKAKRKIKVTLTRSPGASSFRYGIQAGTGGLTMNSEAKVYGNVYSNGNIVCNSNSKILGDGKAVGTITPANCPTGFSQPGVATSTMPEFDRDYWISAAEAGGATGSISYDRGVNYLGPKRINGNLTVAGATLIVTGPIYATGTMEFNSESKVKLDDAFDSDGTVMLADDRIALNANAKVLRPNKTAILRPESDYTAQWSVSPAGSHWSALDDAVEEPAAADTLDRIISSTNDQIDEFDFATASDATTTSEVIVWAYARNTAASNGDRLGINLVIGGAPQSEIAKALTTSWGWVSAIFSFDPPLTKSQLDGLRVRLREDRVGGQDSVEAAALYAKTTYVALNAGYIMFVSDRSTGQGIELNSDSKGGTFYARNALLQVNSNSEPIALTGKEILLNSNAEIFYDEGLPDQAFTSGPGGTWEIKPGSWLVVE